MNIKFSRLTTAILILVAVSTLAQTPVEQVSLTPTITPTPTATELQDQPSTMQTQNMDKMATTMTQMAEMCQAMMQKEKAAMPYIAGAAASLGVLLLIALILFVILEVQWIIYWKRVLKAQAGSGR